MTFEPLSYNDDQIFESHLDGTHLPEPQQQTSKSSDLEGIRERIFGEKNKDLENSTGVNSKSLEESGNLEENNDHLTEWLEETYFEDEDFLQAAAAENIISENEDETAAHKTEASINKEDAGIQEDDQEVSEAEIAQAEESVVHREKIEESRLDLEGDKVEQEAEREIDEGTLKTVAGDEATLQVNAEVDQIDAEASARVEDVTLINGKLQKARYSAQLSQSFIHQCNELLPQDEFKRNDNFSSVSNNSSSDSKITIEKVKIGDDRVKHVQQIIQLKIEQLNYLDARNKVDSHSINEAIKNELKRESFENVYDENGILLREDETSINQLTQDIIDYKQDHLEENLSTIVQHRIAVWLSSKNLHEKNSQGDLVPISQERQRELVTILSYAVVIEIVNQVALSQMTSKEDKIEDRLTSALDVTGDVRQQEFKLIHGQRFQLASLESNGTVLKENPISKLETELENAKSLEKSNLDILDHASRISQMITSKEIITSEIARLDQEHVLVIIDRVRIRKLKGMS